ncbi:hypothetical protein MIND_00721600 [Mycena indigotica]|uniref:Uncharacterized protein n=1 Tax=Mycena indigotica TaxID=2126181 RepID=A0A8H6W3G9_9AGAR|nr:uncharacterized protein MIND_00721600 [Mycena indigotica]KAF7301561.1 hypothetical protein MIND_00721600 [Mycena indigotica]
MFHTIVLLASSSPSMAINAACTYVFCSFPSILARQALNHFVVYANQPISQLPSYSKRCYSFVLGSYESDLVFVAGPPDRYVRIRRSPGELKRQYLAYVRKTVALLRDGSDDTLFLPILAPCDAGHVHLGQGVSISLEELAQTLQRSSSSSNVKLWMPECNDPCWAVPGLPWSVLDKVSPVHDRLLQAKPLNIKAFLLPKLVDEAPRYFKYTQTDLDFAKVLVADLKALIASIDPSKLDHPSDYLCYAVRHIWITRRGEIPIAMRLCRIRDVADVNRAGDILAHRLDCFMTAYVLSRHVFGTPLDARNLADTIPHGAYWHWLEAACMAPVQGHYFEEFLETTKIPLVAVKNLLGSVGLFSDNGYAKWTEVLSVIGINS